MKLLCVWSEKEGKPALIAEVEPRADPTPTHGMCPARRQQVEEEPEALRQQAASLEKETRPCGTTWTRRAQGARLSLAGERGRT